MWPLLHCKFLFRNFLRNFAEISRQKILVGKEPNTN